MVLKRVGLAVALVLGMAGSAVAQDEVSLGCYLVDKIGTGVFPDSYRAEYIGDFGTVRDPMVPPATVRPRYAAMDLGIEPTFLVCAELTAAQHAFVAAQSDVFVIPALDTQVGGNPTLNQVKTKLEQRNIPGTSITATTTWRQVVGLIGRNCQILQRLNGLHQTRLFPPGVSLDSTPDTQTFDQLVQVGESFGLDTSGLLVSQTVRTILLTLTDQMPPFTMLAETF